MSQKSDGTEPLPTSARSKVKVGDLERPRLDHSLYTAPTTPPDTIGTDPDDGLPRPFASTSLKDAMAPSMSPESFVCMADTRSFVLRSQTGKVVAKFEPDQVGRDPDGTYIVLLSRALEHGAGFRTSLKNRRGLNVVVEPVRPQCKHYRRQLRPWHDDSQAQQCIRYCAALTDEHGEMVSLNDENLTACELRSPQDWESVRQIDEFDERVVAAGATDDEEEEFDVDAELDKAGGIFSTEGG